MRSKTVKTALVSISFATVLFGFGSVSPVIVSQAVAQAASTEPEAYVDLLVAQARALLAEEPRDPAKAALILGEAAKADNPEAMVLLAGLYASGDGVARDLDLARSWIDAAIALNGASLDIAWAALGDLYLLAEEGDRDLAKVIDAYQRAVDHGNLNVLVPLATMIADGADGGADLDRMRAVLLKGSALQTPDAAAAWARLGDLYYASDAPNASSKAVEAYKQAVQRGETSVLVRLGEMVGAGEGGAPDFALAKEYLEAATELADTTESAAWAALGDLYREAEGEHRNLASAADAYQRALDLGNLDVLIPLAQIVGLGDPGIPADFERAKSLLDQAISLDNNRTAAAWIALGNLYRSGDSANADMSKAAFAYEQAAKAGDAVAMVHLARILGTGDGRPADFAAAKALLEEAIASGRVSAWAWTTLGDLYRTANDADRDLAAAVAAYQEAASLDDTGAMLKLANMVGKGEGVPADFDRAKALLTSVIAAGGDDTFWAWMALGELYATADQGHRDQAKAIEAYRNALAIDEGGAAWYALGDLYGDGDAGIRDLALAIDAYAQAAALGETGALIDHALILGPGEFNQAKALIEQAIEIGDRSLPRAWVALGDLYRNADDAHRDLAAAVAAYRNAADAGHTSGMIKLARLIGWGEGADRDFDGAAALLEGAIAVNDGTLLWAWATLGDLYRVADPERADAAKAIEAYAHAAQGGDSGSMVKIGEILGRGEGIAPDFVQAKEWLERAIAEGDSDTMLWALSTLGDLYDNEGPHRDMQAAADTYQRAVELGDVGSTIALAEILWRGDGVAADIERGRALLDQAITADDRYVTSAWATLGDLYRDTDTIDRHLAKAADAYLEAANRGHTSSMIKLARIVGWGNTVPEDFDTARKLLEQAISSGGGTTAWALATLGDLYMRNSEHRDLRKAAEAYVEAANLGDTGAMIKLANLRYSGEKPDFEAARELLDRAIAVNDDNATWAWGTLADLYFYAGEAHRDRAMAAAAYGEAAKGGDTTAMVTLAVMLAKGDGVGVNADEAVSLLNTAIAADDDNAGLAWRMLGDVHRTRAKPDFEQAASAYGEAVERGDNLAMIRLARLMMTGQGLPADVNKAQTLLLTAIGSDGEHTALGWATLGDLYREAPPPRQNLDSAIKAYERAVEGDDAGAMVELARLLGLEASIEKDFPRAIALLNEATEIVGASDYEGDVKPVGIWLALGDLYRFGEGRNANPAAALQFYEKAAETGDAYAHLSAGELESLARVNTPKRVAAMVDHYRKAAEAMGVNAVAKVMYGLDPASLVFTAQGFLADLTPGSLSVDGVLGAKTAGAITAFCGVNGLACDDGTIITFDLLEALLRAKPTAMLGN